MKKAKKNNKKRAILLGTVPLSTAELKAILKNLKIKTSGEGHDILIGVDAGTERWIKLGYQPAYAVGDWDSLKDRKVLADIPHLNLKQDKDRSDLYFAVMAAIRMDATEIVCLGVTGGRPDHHQAMLLDLGEFCEFDGVQAVSAVGPEADYYFVSSKGTGLKLKVKKAGQLVSIFSLGGVAHDVDLQGFQYPLTSATLQPSSHGLSNHTLRQSCEIQVGQGKLLVIVPR